MFTGSIVALITPLESENINVNALKNLCTWHIDQGTDGILVCGSTGEGLLLSDQHRNTAIETVVATVDKKIPVIAGCGLASTDATIQQIKIAEKLGADAALVVTPFYVKPPQDAIYQHFCSINNSTGLPIIVYNNPGRAGVDISTETQCKILNLENCVGVKESSSDLTRIVKMNALRRNSYIPANRTFLSGDDPTLAAHILLGGDGVMSVVANIVPKHIKKLTELLKNGDLDQANQLNESLMSLYEGVLEESNPTAIKALCAEIHKFAGNITAPLQNASLGLKNKLLSCLKEIEVSYES